MKTGGFKPKVVAIGGGTGLSTMLRGLKEYTPNITAVVTVADDGGGSGQLRDELKMLYSCAVGNRADNGKANQIQI